MRKSQPLLILVLLVLTVSILVVGLQAGAERVKPLGQSEITDSGRITDQVSKKSIESAQIFFVADGGEQYSITTDAFGLFRSTEVPAGVYNISISRAGYHSLSEIGFEVTQQGSNVLARELIPVADTFDIYVEVSCVTTGLQLSDVPVTVSGTFTNNNEAFSFAGQTDEMGTLHFAGLRAGVFSFVVNEGGNRRSGWESISLDAEQVSDTRLLAALLKPVPQELTVSVRGFNPVNEQENALLQGIVVEAEGVHPDDTSLVLLPTQTGVSGVRKVGDAAWDNTMVGKVKFTGLPAIPWQLTGKRLGYNPGQYLVGVDGDDKLTSTAVTLNMELQSTQITVLIETPYRDPELAKGLKVRLQGLADTNTAGIDRTRTVQYQVDKDRAVVIFDKILPGNYLLSVNDQVTKTVPILVEGQDVQLDRNDYRPANRFSVRFSAVDYIDAYADVTREVVVRLEPERLTFTGVLNMVSINEDHEGPWPSPYTHNSSLLGDASYPAVNWHTSAGQKVEIRASEYYADYMPEESQLVEVTTDERGTFTVSLLPGLYGVAVPGLTEYFGGALTLEDPAKGSSERRKQNWPYYQTWNGSVDSLNSFLHGYGSYKWGASSSSPGGIGGVGLSSGQNLEGWFLLLKKQALVEMGVRHYGLHEIIARGTLFEWENEQYFYNDGSSYLQVSGADEVSASFASSTGPAMFSNPLIITKPGSYEVEFVHPDYTDMTLHSGYRSSFDFYDFPPPGLLPAQAFPADYTGLFPLYSEYSFGEVKLSDNRVPIKLYMFNASTNAYVLLGDVYPQLYSYSKLDGRILDRGIGSAMDEPYTMWYKAEFKGPQVNNPPTYIIWYRFESTSGTPHAIYWLNQGYQLNGLISCQIVLPTIGEARVSFSL